jgi:hypothetical protein
MIRKLKTGEYRIYSLKKNLKTGKRRNLGTFTTREAAEKHERENEPPRSKLRGISWLVATLQAKQASGNITRRDLNHWIPAFAGMTKKGKSPNLTFLLDHS